MSSVFISYRRADSVGSTGRLYDLLSRRIGRRRVFRDHDTIAPGDDFEALINEVLAESEIVLVVIGPRWLQAEDQAGARRLDDPEDLVRIEVAAALRADQTRVVPVLVDGARLPDEQELPDDLRPLTDLHAIELRQARFDDDAADLFDRLELRDRRRLRRASLAVGGVVLAVMAAVALVLWDGSGTDGAEVMTGAFNVAVAEMSIEGQAGSSDGTDVGQFLTERLRTELAGIEVATEVWGPSQTGSLDGSSADERQAEAAERAQEIGADVLIFGLISSDGSGDTSLYRPEFYLSDRAAGAEPSLDLDGTFGLPTSIPRPFADQLELAGSPPGFSARLNAMGKIVIGLSFLSIENYGDAVSSFDAALTTDGWAESDGHEIAHLLRGNALLQTTLDDGGLPADFEDAREAFQAAAAIDTELARAEIGIAAVDYLAAAGDRQSPHDDVDLDALEAVAGRLQSIVDSLPDDSSPEAASAAAFNLGQTHLVAALGHRDQGGAEAASIQTERAELAYRAVIDRFEAEGGSAGLVPFASRAHARLGFIAFEAGIPTGDFTEATEAYRRAIDIAPPILGATFEADLAAIVSLSDNCAALELLDQAMATFDLYGRQTLRAELEPRRQREQASCESES